MSVIESIVRDLHELPTPKLVEVAGYFHALNSKSKERRRAALQASAVCLAGEEGAVFGRSANSTRENVTGTDCVKLSLVLIVKGGEGNGACYSVIDKNMVEQIIR